MYYVEIIDSKKDGMKDLRILTKRVYNNLQNALSDIVDGNSELHNIIYDYGYVDYEADKPIRIYAGSQKPNGYGDDFHFRYPNGIIICVGELSVDDEGKEN